MAASFKTTGALGKKKIHLPSQMGARTTEVKAVGAWVQPEYERIDNHYLDAVLSAQVEEERMYFEQDEKEAKLRRFQDEVRQRVQKLQKLKRQQQLDKSYKAVEAERNVVGQSAFAAEKCTPRRNRCTLRQDQDLSIKHSASYSSVPQQGIIMTTDHPLNRQEKDQAFAETKEKVHKYTNQARKKLVSRQVITDHYLQDSLPGGVWKSGATRDKPASRQTQDCNVLDLEEEAEDDSHKVLAPGVEQTAECIDMQEKGVQFEWHGHTNKEKKLNSQSEKKGKRVSHKSLSASVPNIYPGVISEEDKIQNQNQRVLYRRLFMDIEREQVKENIRRQQHKKKINQLKKKAEEERLHIEEQARSVVEPKDPLTGETPSESYERDQVERRLLEKSRLEHKSKARKNKEMERFLEALKRNLREKIENHSKELPPLCCCGDAVWDTNPDTCANNCVFYKNPKAYAQALQSLLASCDVV